MLLVPTCLHLSLSLSLVFGQIIHFHFACFVFACLICQSIKRLLALEVHIARLLRPFWHSTLLVDADRPTPAFGVGAVPVAAVAAAAALVPAAPVALVAGGRVGPRRVHFQFDLRELEDLRTQLANLKHWMPPGPPGMPWRGGILSSQSCA
jgi:hypothetical protein